MAENTVCFHFAPTGIGKTLVRQSSALQLACQFHFEWASSSQMTVECFLQALLQMDM